MELLGAGAPGYAKIGPALRVLVGELDLVVAFEAPRPGDQTRLALVVGDVEEAARVPAMVLQGGLDPHTRSLRTHADRATSDRDHQQGGIVT